MKTGDKQSGIEIVLNWTNRGVYEHKNEGTGGVAVTKINYREIEK